MKTIETSCNSRWIYWKKLKPFGIIWNHSLTLDIIRNNLPMACWSFETTSYGFGSFDTIWNYPKSQQMDWYRLKSFEIICISQGPRERPPEGKGKTSSMSFDVHFHLKQLPGYRGGAVERRTHSPNLRCKLSMYMEQGETVTHMNERDWWLSRCCSHSHPSFKWTPIKVLIFWEWHNIQSRRQSAGLHSTAFCT